jgi:hypothetical protein
MNFRITNENVADKMVSAGSVFYGHEECLSSQGTKVVLFFLSNHLALFR